VRPEKVRYSPEGYKYDEFVVEGEADNTPRVYYCYSSDEDDESEAVEVASMGVAAPAVRALPPALPKPFEQVDNVYVAALPDGSKVVAPTFVDALRAHELGGDLAEAMAKAVAERLDVPGLELTRFDASSSKGCWRYAGFPLITSRKLAVDFAAAIADLPGSGSAVQAYEDIVERPYKIEHLEHHVDAVGKHYWTYEDLPVITDRSHAVAFAEGLKKLGPSPSAKAVAKVYAETVEAAYSVEGLALGRIDGGRHRSWHYPGMPLITDRSQAEAFAKGLKKLGPSPSAKAVAKVYAETVDAGYTYEFLKLGRVSKKDIPKRAWTCQGFGELDSITSRTEAVAFSAALKALDQKAPDHGFLLAEVASLVEPHFNLKYNGVRKTGSSTWGAQFGSKYLGVHATSVAAAKAYDRHILETASDYQGRRLKTRLAKLNFPEVLLLSCKRARTA